VEKIYRGMIVWLKKVEIDRTVAWGLAYRLLEAISGPVTMIFVIVFFNPDLQGYFYTFKNLLNFQNFADLGLGIVIVQFAGHEFSRLSLTKDGFLIGDGQALSRLQSLAKFATRWFFLAGVLFVIVIIPIGHFIFKRPVSHDIAWVYPWMAVAFFTGLGLLFVPVLSLLEGCHQVASVYKIRLARVAGINSFCWLSIFLGLKLWSLAIYTISGILVALLLLLWKYQPFLKQIFFSEGKGQKIEWGKEVLPMQWRLACSSVIGGYLSFSLFTPVLFYYHGPVLAGRMGMTWAIVSALSASSIMVVYTKAPAFAALIARKDYLALDRLFFRSVFGTLILCAVGSVALLGLISCLNYFNVVAATRLLPLKTIAILLLATIFWQVSFAQAIYLRAHKREPFFWLSVISGLLIAISTFVFGKKFGAAGIAWGYLIIVLFFVIPLGTFVWLRCRKMWHKG